VTLPLRGAVKLITTEHSVMVQFFLEILVTIAGFYFEITTTEWFLQTLVIGLVMSVEGLNTAIEKMADFIHPDYHQRIGFIKILQQEQYFCGNYIHNYWFNHHVPRIF
jgi:diacylglycerol kinase (ATP)